MKTNNYIILFLTNVFFMVHVVVFGQSTYNISGYVSDAQTLLPLSGVTILINNNNKTVTDTAGKYELSVVSEGSYTIQFSYIGYQTVVLKIQVAGKGKHTLNAILEPISNSLEQIVISAGKFKQNLKDITVSMDLLQPKTIEAANPKSMEEIFDQISGVTVTKGQIKIRNGSGYSYGVGSRVNVLVDGLPLLSGDGGEVKWNLLPMSQIEQVEVIKGASSALYGASSLDGTINIITASAKEKPATEANVSMGMYGTPPIASWKYWDKPPLFKKIELSHTRKIKNIGITANGEWLTDDAYRRGEASDIKKAYLKIEHIPTSATGFKYGIRATWLHENRGTFLYWLSLDSAYVPFPKTVTQIDVQRWVIDPYIKYYTPKGSTHAFTSRIFYSNQKTDDNHDSQSTLYYGEYQFQSDIRVFDIDLFKLTSGLVANYTHAYSPDMYGTHSGHNFAVYAQMDKKIKRLNLSAGGRLERFGHDDLKALFAPVFRTGVSFQVFRATYLRASAGQGFRYPAISERFIFTRAGGITILPNPDISPEKGWSAEIGLRQGLGKNVFKAYIDVAAFYSRYNDMIEFAFNQYKVIENGTEKLYIGFKGLNLEATKVYGIESNVSATLNIKSFEIQATTGYTYANPLNVNYVRDPKKDTLGTEQYLRYRNKHSVKSLLQVRYKAFTIGGQYRYNSFMMNIDPILNILIPKLKDFRTSNRNNDQVVDVFLAADVLKHYSIAINVKNLLNTPYMPFPGNMGAPRNYALSVRARF